MEIQYNSPMKSLPRDIITTFIIAVIAFFALHAAIESCVVIGPSMEPTVEEEQRLIINKLAYFFKNPERGDIVIFHPLNAQQTDYIKRIIAIPGDTVEIKNGAVYVNGIRLNEPYIKDPPYYSFSPREVPANNYFVLGDNRNNSNDSHNGWTIPRRNVIGKAWLRIWPLTSAGFLPGYPLDSQLAANPGDNIFKAIRQTGNTLERR